MTSSEATVDDFVARSDPTEDAEKAKKAPEEEPQGDGEERREDSSKPEVSASKSDSDTKVDEPERRREPPVEVEPEIEIIEGVQRKKKRMEEGEEEQEEEGDLSCDLCDRKFVVKSSYLNHMKINHLTCHYCNKVCSKKSGLELHLRTHKQHEKKPPSDEKKVECTYCKMKFDSNVLERHITHVHFTCQICFKTFKSMDRLDTHGLMHKQNPQFNCDICGKVFTIKFMLDLHKQQHNRRNAKHKCEICGLGFSNLWRFNLHKQQHGPNSGAPRPASSSSSSSSTPSASSSTRPNEGQSSNSGVILVHQCKYCKEFYPDGKDHYKECTINSTE